MPPNPAEVLSSRRFAQFIDRVRQEFDYVLIDTPPMGLVSDPAILATRADGVLLVGSLAVTLPRSLCKSKSLIVESDSIQ